MFLLLQLRLLVILQKKDLDFYLIIYIILVVLTIPMNQVIILSVLMNLVQPHTVIVLGHFINMVSMYV